MDFKIPFTFSNIEKLKKNSRPFTRFFRKKDNTKSKLLTYLENSSIEISKEEYLGICIRSALYTFFIASLFLITLIILLKLTNFIVMAILASILISIFIFITQVNYPRAYDARKERDIEKNLIPVLQDMLVQLNSGIPTFNILVNISEADYGPLSSEFKKAVRQINAGIPQIEVLEKLSERNNSPFLRRTLWQISNGMRAGSDISIIIKESIKSLNEEQLIQIQNYGNKLNPLIMFYMLISVIIPALSITFLTIISSLVNLPGSITRLMFIGLFTGAVIIQTIFLGIIRSIRPSLL